MRTILPVVIGATLALCAVKAGAQAVPGDRQVALVIESKTLADALDQWAQQSGFQILLKNWDMAKKLTAPSLKGTFSAQAALEQLLSGTSLVYEFTSERTVTVRARVTAASSTTGAIERVEAPWLHIAKLSAAEERSAPARESETDATRAVASRDYPTKGDVEELEEIVVTGTHIRGLQKSTVPMFALDKTYIESTGISTATRLIETLPQNFALANQSGVLVPGVSESTTQGSSINLRGLGEGTTLVLLNGRRMASGFGGAAPDIAALPLTAVERVEILTDGASAIYGSDAVGGVVNFVLRRDFNGAETRLQTGHADGLSEYRLSQALGNAWASGNALLSLEYYKRDLLDASDRDFVPESSGVGSLLPRDKNHSVLVSAHQDVTDGATLFVDVLYSKRDGYHEGDDVLDNGNFEIDNLQMSANGGVDWKIADEWRVEATAGYARNKLDTVRRADSLAIGGGGAVYANQFEIDTARVQADGSLFTLPGGEARAAVGVDWRSESFEFSLRYRNGEMLQEDAIDQIVRGVFGEVYVPIVGSQNARRGINGLELSLAGRYDVYSSFGSSFDPQLGIMWEPLAGLRLRSSYGTSYVAPRLHDYSLAANFAAALYSADAGSPSGESHVLEIQGNAVETYAAQESKNWTFGFDLAPRSMPDLKLGMNYYRIDYSNRIANPPFFDVILNNSASFGNLAIRNPSLDQINHYIAIGQLSGLPLLAFDRDFNDDANFDPSSIDLIVDERRRNLSIVKTSGLDLSLHYGFDVAGSSLQVGLMGTYVLELEHQVTSTSEPVDTIDTYYNPPDLRVRGSLGWQRLGWQANVFVNYTDSYLDNRQTIPTEISSNTTVDAHVAYKFAKTFLSGVTIATSVQNLFDRDPPQTAVLERLRDLGFDPANASPLGRLVAIEVTKVW